MTKTETKSTVLLRHHLKALKLPTMLAEAEKITQRGAADNADHLAFLLQLVVLELIERGRKVRFFRVTELVTLLLEAKEERHLLRLRQQLA